MKIFFHRLDSGLKSLAVRYLGFIIIAGCGSATGVPTQRASLELPRPDRVLVYDFAVTPEQVSLDRGILPRVMRTVAPPQTEEEIKVGEVVARALSDTLVLELRAHGIDAHLASKSAPAGETTGSIRGRFVHIDEGDQTMRTVIGFGFGGSQVRTHVQIFQGPDSDARLVAEGDTVTQSGLKPGMGPAVGVGAIAGRAGTAAAVSGAATVVSETFFQTVEADAKRTAKEIADHINRYYKERGWIER
jgi:Domain of unknown function (DUF4410)